MRLRILTWNVDGISAVAQRRGERAHEFLQKLNADIVCLQETKLSKADTAKIGQLSNVPGWKSFFGLSRMRSGYAGVVTFCKDSTVPVIAAEEGLCGTDHDNVSDSINRPPDSTWDGLASAHLHHNDNEGRAVITDHGLFVLIHLYGPAVTEVTAERFPRKLTFYESLQRRVENFLAQGRQVIIAGDLNIAREPVDNCDWADSKLAPGKLLEAFLEARPDRKWFMQFLSPKREGAPVDLLRRFHPNRRKAYTVWGRYSNKRQRNFGSRVDYILLAEPSLEGDSDVQAVSLLSKVTACDIQTDWEGSDHAPVWADLDIEFLPQLYSQPVPRMESRKRFQVVKGGQQQLSAWLKSPAKKRKREGGKEGTPPRQSLGDAISGGKNEGRS